MSLRPSISTKLLLVVVLTGCGEGGSTEPPPTPPPTQNPVPTLLSVSPSTLAAGSGATTLTVTGNGFVATSKARWNGVDQPTRFVSARTLEVDLSADAVRWISDGKVTVVNPAPGGGTSGELAVTIAYATPSITSITPNTVAQPASPSEAVIVRITGSGFVIQSNVRIGTWTISVTPISYTEIELGVPSQLVNNAGTYQVSVVNPGPGGGSSNIVDLNVVNAAPTISALSPDSALAGVYHILTVHGTGFSPASVIQFNGVDRMTSFENTTRISTAVNGSEIATASDAVVAVFNPAPGGGSSNTATYRIRESGAFLANISPAFVSAGASAPTITLTGWNFRSGARVHWNGQERSSSFTSAFTMTVTLMTSDVVNASNGVITVINPNGRLSNPIVLAILPPALILDIARTIALEHVDIVYDNARGVFYASVPSAASAHANSVARIDPTTGAITATLNVGLDPRALAITDDHQFLYVALRGESKIIRIALASFTTDLEIPVPSDSPIRTAFAEDILAMPGASETIAVSTFYSGSSPRTALTLLFDRATRRPAAGPAHTGSNRITRGPTSARIFGINNATTEYGFRSLVVAPNGLHEDVVKRDLIGRVTDIEYDGGYVYGTDGDVVDVSTMFKVGSIPYVGTAVRPDAANARVHFLGDTEIRTYHYKSFGSIGSFTHASLIGHDRLVRWGSDGLAVGGGATIVLLRGTLVGQ